MSLAINSLNLLFYNKHKWYPLAQQQPCSAWSFQASSKKQEWFNVQWLLFGGCLCAMVFCALWVSPCPSKKPPVTDSWVFWGCFRYPHIPEEGKPAFFQRNDYISFKCICVLFCTSFPRCFCYLVLLCPLVLYKPCRVGVLIPNGPFRCQGDYSKCSAQSWLQICNVLDSLSVWRMREVLSRLAPAVPSVTCVCDSLQDQVSSKVKNSFPRWTVCSFCPSLSLTEDTLSWPLVQVVSFVPAVPLGMVSKFRMISVSQSLMHTLQQILG